MLISTSSCKSDHSLIDISGNCNPSDTSEIIRQFPYWKQMYVTESLQIPSVKPDIEQVNSISVSVNVFSQKVIKTPRSYDDTVTPPAPQPNLEGKLLTGRKLIIEGELCQLIEYTAAEATQPVHSVEFFVPFSAYIVVPLEVTLTTTTGSTVVDSYNVNYKVNACVENTTACVNGPRTIQKQVTLMLSATPVGQSC